MKSLSATAQMKASEQYVRLVLFIMSWKVVLILEPVSEILKCDNSYEDVELSRFVW